MEILKTHLSFAKKKTYLDLSLPRIQSSTRISKYPKCFFYRKKQWHCVTVPFYVGSCAFIALIFVQVTFCFLYTSCFFSCLTNTIELLFKRHTFGLLENVMYFFFSRTKCVFSKFWLTSRKIERHPLIKSYIWKNAIIEK